LCIDDVVISAIVPTEPVFAITPEEYTFPAVGLLDGAVYTPAPNATFTISNDGIGTFDVTELDFFTGHPELFSIPAGDLAELPVSLGVGESWSFEVAFEPTASGDFCTQLIVTDDLARIVRGFDVCGSAYVKPEGDVLDNAFALGNFTDSDLDENIDFGHFYMDYDLGGSDADVVYTFDLDLDSFFSASGADHVDVFEAGTAITDGNELYHGVTLDLVELDAGSYVVVFTGSGANDLSLHAEGADPIFAMSPDGTLDLGNVPVGGWYCPREFVVWNDGGQYFTIHDFDLSDVEGVFELRPSISTDDLPYDVYSGDILTLVLISIQILLVFITEAS
jgi:hypothetical protein